MDIYNPSLFVFFIAFFSLLFHVLFSFSMSVCLCLSLSSSPSLSLLFSLSPSLPLSLFPLRYISHFLTSPLSFPSPHLTLSPTPSLFPLSFLLSFSLPVDLRLSSPLSFSDKI